MTNPAEYLPLIIETARAAGAQAMASFRRPDALEVSMKGQADLLCQIDTANERMIRGLLTDAHPDIAFLGEESGASGPADAELCWTVDPIDGTTNYISGLPFAVSIALVRGNEPLAGVIYEPVADEVFAAAQGHGATLNGEPIRVRNEVDPARFVVATGLPLDQHAFSGGAYLRLHAIREEVAAVRIIGAAALGFAYTAAGRIDGYFEGPTGFLDFAAGLVILQEAGGIVTDFWGQPDHAVNATTTIGAGICHTFLLQHTRMTPRHSPYGETT